MYSSIDRIDVVTEDEQSHRKTYHQTDHRERAEVEAEPELSVLFALTRVLNPLRMAESEGAEADVVYVCFSPPPDFLSRAVFSAGGRVAVHQQAVPYEGALAEPADLANEALRGLAERVRARLGGDALDGALLRRLEQEVQTAAYQREKDEVGYWTALMELSAVCGEVLRAKVGGRWVADTERLSLVPFAFKVAEGGGFYNVIGRAERFLEQGESQRVSQLLAMAEDRHHAEADAPLMVALKPASWGGRAVAVWRPLLEGGGDERLPLAVLCRDLPNSVMYPKADRVEEREQLFAEALKNLQAIEVEVRETQLEELRLWVVTGSYYAAEKLLDERLMKALQERLGVELLAVAAPHRGLLLVTSGVVEPRTMAKFLAVSEGRFREAGGQEPLCPVPLLVRDGRVQGYLQAGEAAPAKEAPKRKGFFARLFGWE